MNAGRQSREKLALGRREARVLELAPEPARPELEPGYPLVQVLARPLREPGVDGVVERHDPFGDAAGRGDDDRHDRARVEQQDLDMPHRRRLERRRGHERELTGYPREHLGRRLEGRVDLTAQLGEVERERPRARILPGEQLVGVEAVALLGRNAARRRVRMGEQASRFELRELVAHGRRRHAQLAALHEVPRADGLAGRYVLLDHEREQLALSSRESCCWIRGHLQEF